MLSRESSCALRFLSLLVWLALSPHGGSAAPADASRSCAAVFAYGQRMEPPYLFSGEGTPQLMLNGMLFDPPPERTPTIDRAQEADPEDAEYFKGLEMLSRRADSVAYGVRDPKEMERLLRDVYTHNEFVDSAVAFDGGVRVWLEGRTSSKKYYSIPKRLSRNPGILSRKSRRRDGGMRR